MEKYLTLNEVIVELQKLALTEGDKQVLGFGGASGIIDGMSSPNTVTLRAEGDSGMGNSYCFASKK